MTRAVQLRQQTSMARWSELITEQRKSGFTVQDFCEQRNLSVHAYYYWLRLIRERIASDIDQEASIKTEKTPFVELPISRDSGAMANDAITSVPPDMVTVNISNISISMPATSSRTTIRNFMSVMKEMF